MGAALDKTARAASGRIIAALAARFRDLELAEEAFSDACLAAARTWPREGDPSNPAAWLYQAAYRRALDAMRRRKVRERLAPDVPDAEPSAEDVMLADPDLIPDERLRLVFVCCHPAIAVDSRAPLTLRLVCGLSARDIAASFLVPESTILQRLTRAKRKIAQARIPFRVPGPPEWPDRLEAVLSTLEVAYAKAHEDASGSSAHAGYADEILRLTAVLSRLLPCEGEVLGLAALVRYAEARRPARVSPNGAMVPLSEQDPRLWRRDLIAEADDLLGRARSTGSSGPRSLSAAIHGVWCARRSRSDPAPWRLVLQLYDSLLAQRDDVVVRLNRAVALAEIEGPDKALAEVESLDDPRLEAFQPWHAVRADLLRRLGRFEDCRLAYDRACDLATGPAERLWLRSMRP